MKTHFKELKPAGIFIGIILGIAFMLTVSFTKTETNSSVQTGPGYYSRHKVIEIGKAGTATVYGIEQTSVHIVVGENGFVAIAK